MRLIFFLLWREQHMTCDLVRILPWEVSYQEPRTTLRTVSNTGLQDRPCARCVKRSIGHLCHDEPRDSVKGIKHDQTNSTSNSGAAVKLEDSLQYLLSPSIDQQQLDEQVLQNAGADVSTRTATADSQTENSHFLPQSSNLTAQGQGQVFGEKNQQCEKHTQSFYQYGYTY